MNFELDRIMGTMKSSLHYMYKYSNARTIGRSGHRRLGVLAIDSPCAKCPVSRF